MKRWALRIPLHFAVLLYIAAVFGAAVGTFEMAGVFLACAILGSWLVVLFSMQPLRVAAGIVLTFMLMSLVVAAVVAVNASAVRDRYAVHHYCTNNVRSIALALLNYESQHGTLPPAYIADSNGVPMHSWRVLILPYLEEEAVYKRYRFDEPWNGPNNIKLIRYMPPTYFCPARGTAGTGLCHYAAVVGPDTVLGRGAQGRKLSEISDGLPDTIVLVERDKGVPWTKPEDMTPAEFLADNNFTELLPRHTEMGYFTGWTFGRAVAFADQHSVRIATVRDLKALASTLTIDGGEQIDFRDSFEFHSSGIAFQWGHILLVALLVILTGLPGLCLVRQRDKVTGQEVSVDP